MPHMGPGGVIADEPHLRIVMTQGATAAEESKRANCPVAVVDWHTAAAGAIGFATTDAGAGKAAQRLARWGVVPYHLPDRPGLVVSRTLSQIANAAADTVLERVSDEAGIDTALRYGAAIRRQLSLGSVRLCQLNRPRRIGRHAE